MVLPLYLAMNASEMSASPLPAHFGWMACHFSSFGCGISNVPKDLPPGAMLILNDRIPCQGHSPDLVASQMVEAADRLGCESLLLDLQRPESPETETVVDAILSAAPCPVAVSEWYAAGRDCPVLLGPGPLHIPLAEYLAPWRDREIWLEAALIQECAVVTAEGTEFSRQFPPEGLEGGFCDEALCCHYHTHIEPDKITFRLFDTPESLVKKLELAAELGVKRAVGLYQELGTFLTG